MTSYGFLSPPEFPASHIKYLHILSSPSEVFLQAMGTFSAMVKLNAKVCAMLGQLIAQAQPSTHGRWGAVIWWDNSKIYSIHFLEDFQQKMMMTAYIFFSL